MVPGYGTVSITGQQQIAAQGATVDLERFRNDQQSRSALGTIRANSDSEADGHCQSRSRHADPGPKPADRSWPNFSASTRHCFSAPHHAGDQPDQRQSALQQIVAQKQQQDALKAGFQDAANYTNTYQTHVAPAYSGGAQALTY